ncbi:MAG: hypothetical protein H7221_05750 [Flavobacterium sp.]|nr:hypothetical protein [Flavobacterium sp.]
MTTTFITVHAIAELNINRRIIKMKLYQLLVITLFVNVCLGQNKAETIKRINEQCLKIENLNVKTNIAEGECYDDGKIIGGFSTYKSYSIKNSKLVKIEAENNCKNGISAIYYVNNSKIIKIIYNNKNFYFLKDKIINNAEIEIVKSLLNEGYIKINN